MTRLEDGLFLSPEAVAPARDGPPETELRFGVEHEGETPHGIGRRAQPIPPAPDQGKRGPGALAGPGIKPYLKSGLPSPAFVEDFRWQAREIDCEPTQVYNLLVELSRRHGDPSVRLGYNVVIGLLPPLLEGVSWNRAVGSLGHRVPANYQVRYSIGSESRWPDVERVLTNEETSLPLIGVSREYWHEVADRLPAADETDHALLVLSSSAERVEVFDSYIAILNRSTRARSPKRRLTMADGIVSVSPVKLIGYWEGAGIPRHLFWVQRKGKKTTQRLLTEQPESR